MDFFDVARNRRSIRLFQDRPISMESIEKIIDTARLSPTARNIQPWRFIAVTDKSRIKMLAQLVSPNGAFLSQAAAAIVIVCEDTKYYIEDGSAATTTALLAAEALGIGGCWIAGDKKDYAQDVVSFLGIEKGMKLVSVIALGYPKGKMQDIPKKSLSDVLIWDKGGGEL